MPKKHNNPAVNIMASDATILTIKQARRLLGKQISDCIDDADLSLMLMGLTYLASSLTSAYVVPKTGKVA